MNIQHLKHLCEQVDRRSVHRSETAVRCPNCLSPHIEEGSPVECGQIPLPWHEVHQLYSVHAYTCMSCGAEFIAGTKRQIDTGAYVHHEHGVPLVS